jgi:hypothetical protein
VKSWKGGKEERLEVVQQKGKEVERQYKGGKAERQRSGKADDGYTKRWKDKKAERW